MTLKDELWVAVREKEQEQFQIEQDSNGLKLHLMPPVGWMNDPNGLCQFRGKYHVFYQYSPLDPQGGEKFWGHYVSEDLLNWKQLEVPLFPDQKFDKNGVYSGSALVEKGKMYLFYTGNVKQERNYDYTYAGREANTVGVTSEDGIHFSEKILLMTNRDYPSTYSCHIRDPKVWKNGEDYYMVQGGRRKKYDSKENSQDTDKGTVLIFHSKDLQHWKFERDITTKERFGYMWECPDYFEVAGNPILSVSPQGLEAQEYCYQNVYQSGYFLLEKELLSNGTVAEQWIPLENFKEWDMGFDFYAPQTFRDEKGRRILIGWAGIPDAEYDNEPTVRKGWQHALTLPRELTWKNGVLCQNPIEEMKQLRKEKLEIEEIYQTQNPVFELELTEIPADCQVKMENEKHMLCISYENGILYFNLSKEDGRGRTERKMLLPKLKNMRIIADTSMVEIYINDGATVITSRYYFLDAKRQISVKGAGKRQLWYLKGLEVSR